MGKEQGLDPRARNGLHRSIASGGGWRAAVRRKQNIGHTARRSGSDFARAKFNLRDQPANSRRPTASAGGCAFESILEIETCDSFGRRHVSGRVYNGSLSRVVEIGGRGAYRPSHRRHCRRSTSDKRRGNIHGERGTMKRILISISLLV